MFGCAQQHRNTVYFLRPFPLGVGGYPLAKLCLPFALQVSILAFSAAAVFAQARTTTSFAIDSIGKGLVPVDGQWKFHVGDDPRWALPQTNDMTGKDGWEELRVDSSWGAQTHPAYSGFAWYRKHIHIDLPSSQLALLVQQVDDVYDVYWNGVLIGSCGSPPPHLRRIFFQGVRIFPVQPKNDNVLAFRVWKGLFWSTDPAELGGFYQPPQLGDPSVIAARKAEIDYAWLRSSQGYFGLETLNGLVAILSLLAWFRNRSQNVTLWLAILSGSSVLNFICVGLQLPIDYDFTYALDIPVIALHDIGLWFLLLYLLDLTTNRQLVRLTQRLAILQFVVSSLDALFTRSDWSLPGLAVPAQLVDALLSVVITVAQAYPIFLLLRSRRMHLSVARWSVAITAFLAEMFLVIPIWLTEGSRFTHWKNWNLFGTTIITLNGSQVFLGMIAEALLLASVVYAVYTFVRDTTQRQNILEMEFRSAGEIQRVLVPDALPIVTGYAVTSAYTPAQEVGGDFFQIVPLSGNQESSALVILGDVSGKGLRAAMAVSMIVGVVRALAEGSRGPGDLLCQLNSRIFGRLSDGFATCIAIQLDRTGNCIFASAGHPSPVLNGCELEIESALPLGIVAREEYIEKPFQLRENDYLALYTDGLLEARNKAGELYGFERLKILFASRPSASDATRAATDFGQEDDITVLTISRLQAGEQSSSEIMALPFEPASV